MPWARIDDGFAHNPKIEAASHAEIGLYVLCLAECSRRLTEGHIDQRLIAVASGHRDDTDTLVDRLVDLKLWVENGDGTYQIPDFLDYNPSAEEVKAKREVDKLRQRTYREKKAHERLQKELSQRDTHRESQRESQAVSPTPVPSRPVPLVVSTDVDTTRRNSGPFSTVDQTTVEHLCHTLADYVANNPENSKRPTVDKAWITDMERMIRIDERTPEQIERCLRWIYEGPGDWWIANIRSPKKLRARFDDLRAQAARKRGATHHTPASDMLGVDIAFAMMKEGAA